MKSQENITVIEKGNPVPDRYFKVEISYSAKVDACISAQSDGEAKGLAERFALCESSVMLGFGPAKAETHTYEPEILVLDITEFTHPEQFGSHLKMSGVTDQDAIPDLQSCYIKFQESLIEGRMYDALDHMNRHFFDYIDEQGIEWKE